MEKKNSCLSTGSYRSCTEEVCKLGRAVILKLQFAVVGMDENAQVYTDGAASQPRGSVQAAMAAVGRKIRATARRFSGVPFAPSATASWRCVDLVEAAVKWCSRWAADTGRQGDAGTGRQYVADAMDRAPPGSTGRAGRYF